MDQLRRRRASIYQRRNTAILSQYTAITDKLMTEHDKKLIAKAESLPRWYYRDIDALIAEADTDEARRKLNLIRRELYDLVEGTL